VISQLRKHLDDRDRPHKIIETLQRRGYRLKQPVELHQTLELPKDSETYSETGPSPRAWRLVAGLFAVGFLAIAAYTWMPASPPDNSIVVMPFENLCGNESDEYLVLALQEELVQMLQGLDHYTVKSGRIRIDEESDHIAKRHAVENVLFGSLQCSGDSLRVNYRIYGDAQEKLADNIVGSRKDLFALQESFALMVREDLVGKSTQILIKRRPSDSDAYDSYRRGIYALEHRGNPGNLKIAIELFKNAIDLDEKYGPPYLTLATAYTLMPYYESEPLAKMHVLALETIEAGIAADPTLADAASFIWGYQYHMEKRWEEAEAAYLRAINADVVDSNAFNWYSRMLASVGRLDESLTQALAGVAIDPESALLNSRVAMAYAWVMKNEKALEYYKRSEELDWDGSTHFLSHAFILLRMNEIEKAESLALEATELLDTSTSWVVPVFSAFKNPADRSTVGAALEAINKAAAEQQVEPKVELIVKSWLGDIEGAMQVAQKLEAPGEAFEMDLLFIPELKAVREHPEFIPLMTRLGITRYWESAGCIFTTEKVACPNR
jgi:TolB-like protein